MFNLNQFTLLKPLIGIKTNEEKALTTQCQKVRCEGHACMEFSMAALITSAGKMHLPIRLRLNIT